MFKLLKWIKGKIFNSILFWIVVGFLATISYVGTIWINQTSHWHTILNIIAMLGSGIFCSAIVSLGFEKANQRKLLAEQRCNREYFFSYPAFKLECIIIDELASLCEYLNIEYSINNDLEEGIKLDESLQTIEELYKKIKNSNCNHKNLNELLIRNAHNYENLLPIITPLLEQNTMFVVSNTISKDGINCLSRLYHYANSIVNQTRKENFNSVIQLKLGFFENASYLLSIVEPSPKTLILNFKIKN